MQWQKSAIQIASLSLKMINGYFYRLSLSLLVETELPQKEIHHLETEYVDKVYVNNELIFVYLLCITRQILRSNIILLNKMSNGNINKTKKTCCAS